MVKYWGRTFTLLGVVCRCCNQCGRWQWRPRHLRKSPPPWFSDFSFEMKAPLQWIIIKNCLFDIVCYMSNCDNHSLKYKIISGDLSNFIWSFIFLTFVLCVLVGCLLDHTLLPHSGSLSRLLLGWIHIIVLCIHLGSRLLINTYATKKSKPGGGVTYHLTFAFTVSPVQINYTHALWPKVLAWTKILFFIKMTLEWRCDNWIEPKRNSYSMPSLLDLGTIIISVIFFYFTQHSILIKINPKLPSRANCFLLSVGQYLIQYE